MAEECWWTGCGGRRRECDGPDASRRQGGRLGKDGNGRPCEPVGGCRLRRVQRLHGLPDAAGLAAHHGVIGRVLFGAPDDLRASVPAEEPRAGHHRTGDQTRERKRSCRTAKH